MENTAQLLTQKDRMPGRKGLVKWEYGIENLGIHIVFYDTLERLEELLQSYEGTVFLVSHDRRFLDNVANRIIEITPDGIIDRRCTYDEYMHIAGQEAE